MNNVTERVIRDLEGKVIYGDVEGAVKLLAERGITGYDAWLAWKAAEVSVMMAQRVYEEHR